MLSGVKLCIGRTVNASVSVAPEGEVERVELGREEEIKGSGKGRE